MKDSKTNNDWGWRVYQWIILVGVCIILICGMLSVWNTIDNRLSQSRTKNQQSNRSQRWIIVDKTKLDTNQYIELVTIKDTETGHHYLIINGQAGVEVVSMSENKLASPLQEDNGKTQ